MRSLPGRLPVLILVALTSLLALARADDDAPAAKPRKQISLIEPPEVALRKFTPAPGLKVDLFAAEPDVRNPVSLSIDEQGRVFVVESERRRSSVIDIRWHKEWLDADLSFRTVQDRRDFLKCEVVSTNKSVLARLTKPGQGGFSDFNKDGVLDWRDLEVQSERIRLLEDSDSDGRADRVSVFADGFTNIVAGVAAGVLATRGDVYFACIPELWRIRSSEFRVSGSELPGASPTRNSKLETRNLISGFGVHIAFGGHDMHGLVFGPDGKLYWSIADRGTDTNLFARIKNPWPGLTPELLADSGCVFRANPDGTDFEVVACGLRNPQELAFDEFGNLFTADNNADGGDKARWLYVVEGADFGWRIGWQWLEARAYQPKLGAWNGERLWHLAESNTAAYLLPPLAHIGHGPAGLAYNPGTGLPSQFDRHFFLCDFPGSVLMWTNIPDGASFKIGPVKTLLSELGPSDVTFGVDGGVYVTDWFKSFEKSDQGRIYRIHDPATDSGAAVQETKRLRAEGMEKRSVKELARLLGHADMRVRLAAQWELARHSNGTNYSLDPARLELARVAITGSNAVTRRHAIWALAQIRKMRGHGTPVGPNLGAVLFAVSRNEDADLRNQILSTAGAQATAGATSQLLGLLKDADPHVRFSAAMALGKWLSNFEGAGSIRDQNRIEEALRLRAAGADELLATLKVNADRDPYIRHAAVLTLARIGDTNALLAATFGAPVPDPARNGAQRAGSETGAPRAVRLGVLLALRRLGSPEVARFLSDPDPQIALESARAIHDVPIPDAMPSLASLLGRSRREEAQTSPPITQKDQSLLTSSATKSELEFFTLRRALNANFRLGHPTNALALAAFAARPDVPEPLRNESLELLADWPKPAGRDHILGVWRPLPPRSAGPAADALRPVFGSLLRSAPKAVRLSALRAAAPLGVKEADLMALLVDTQQFSEVRVEALKSLAELNDDRIADALAIALVDKSEALRIAATRLKSASGSGDAVQLARTLETGSLAEKQGALAALAVAKSTDAGTVLAGQLDRLLAGSLAPELQLDLLEAAGQSTDVALKEKLARYRESLPKDDPLAAYRPVLHGGNAESGRKNFIDNQQIACFRCHKINGEGGDVGPDLTGIGTRKPREYILESIIFPNKQIAAGFESLTVTLKNGVAYAGLVKQATDSELLINSPEDGLVKIPVADIKDRQPGLSAMPEELSTFLTRHELRDLVEFLVSLK